jgi:hypothetical protein
MADLVIRGIEIPKNGRITIQIGADGAVYFVDECTIFAEKYEKSSYAIPLPDVHGRLGDLDALEAKFREEALQHTFTDDLNRMTVGMGEAIDRIRIAKTIVSAEEGINNGN